MFDSFANGAVLLDRLLRLRGKCEITKRRNCEGCARELSNIDFQFASFNPGSKQPVRAAIGQKMVVDALDTTAPSLG